MEINGPLKIAVINDPETPGWQLLVRFRDEFKHADLAEQGHQFEAYLQTLKMDMANLPPGDRNRDGMAIIYQLCSQILPYIQAGQIALEEPMMVEIGQTQALSLTDLLNG